MKVEFIFDRSKVEQQGYSMPTIYQTIQKNFAAKNQRCTKEQETLAFEDNGGENDFSGMWSIIMALLRTDWFPKLASSCVWYEDDGSEEDVLSQAWKVRGQKMA